MIRRPQIRFETQAPPLDDALPRMDVAALVGFASAGPIHTPVAVEDVRRFREVFGADLPLAWDSLRQTTRHGQLGPSVESFFANGGRRCWIIRVAGDDAASSRFTLPGLWRADDLRPASAAARAAGGWADGISASAILQSVALPLDAVRFEPNFELTLAATQPTVEPGELVRLHLGQGVIALLVVSDTEVTRSAHRPTEVLRRLRVDRADWFQTRCPFPFLPATRSAWLLGGSVPRPLTNPQLLETPDGYALRIADPGFTLPGPVGLIRVELENDLHFVMTLNPASSDTFADAAAGSPIESSPPERDRLLSADEGLWPISQEQAQQHASNSPPPERAWAERLRMELLAWRGEEIHARLSDLAFSPRHARYWGSLPSDERLFGSLFETNTRMGAAAGVAAGVAGVSRPLHRQPRADEPFVESARAFDLSQLERDAMEPRFPLAGGEAEELFVPIGMATRPDPNRASAAEYDGRSSRLVREGLATFNADLFLDPDLADKRSTVVDEANHKRYLGDSRQRLRGFYSVLDVPEVTLIGVPDASQRAWRPRPSDASLCLEPPRLEPIVAADDGTAIASWSPAAGAVRYELQRSSEATFGDTRPEARQTQMVEGTEAEVAVDRRCQDRLFFRVRAVLTAGGGPWSNTRLAESPAHGFVRCDEYPAVAPVLVIAVAAGGSIHLRWNNERGDGYQVEQSSQPDFAVASSVSTTSREAHLQVSRRSVAYFRVRCRSAAAISPWSNTVCFDGSASATWVLEPVDAYDDQDLLAVHQALLRFCEARGDLLAALSLPDHYRSEAAGGHVARLTPSGPKPSTAVQDFVGRGVARVPRLSLAERPVLGFAAVYHPWVGLARDGGAASPLSFAAPDGVALGSLAATALERAPWIAAANDPLHGISALDPAMSDPAMSGATNSGAAMSDGRLANVNVIERTSRGFLLMSSETLATDERFRPIEVRRLLTLLRRLALREGEAYLFQSNDAALRRLVKLRFERLLTMLYARNAFAGRSADEAFRVVISDIADARSEIDQGRLVIELRIAPSRPLKFLTVRLIQTSREGLSLKEELV